MAEEFGKIEIKDKIIKASLFNTPNGTSLFTFEEGRKISIYSIIAYVKRDIMKKKKPKSITKGAISNFKISKKATLQLEYKPKDIESYGDYFVITYENDKR